MTVAAAAPLAVIAGTGFTALDALSGGRQERVETAYGLVVVTRGDWHGLPVAFVPRHRPGHSVPPHRINHRATIRALADLGCRDVLAVNVTGGIDPTLAPGSLVVLDDFLDLTRQRPLTFHDDDVVHTDMTDAYHPVLRAELLAAAGRAGVEVRDGGVYACFEGPRFETPAEIRLAALAGGSVVGMTGVPEVVLAVEAGLRYAALSLVVNPAAGVGGTAITMAQIEQHLTDGAPRVLAVLEEVVRGRVAANGREAP